MRELTHLSLFSGIGGIDLAAEWAGFRTIGQVEKADYPFRCIIKALAGCAEMEGCL
jgi:DNA (cytosine-5)-methyltransferase 1